MFIVHVQFQLQLQLYKWLVDASDHFPVCACAHICVAPSSLRFNRYHLEEQWGHEAETGDSGIVG